MTLKDLLLFVRLSRPIFLLGAALFYFLGVGIAHYLGYAINFEVFFLGLLWVSLCQLSAQYLNEYFNSIADGQNLQRTFLTGGSGVIGPGGLSRKVALFAAYTSLAILASITVLLFSYAELAPSIYLIMVFALFVSIFYSTPPLKLEGSGYGELLVSILIAFFVPGFAYILQTGEWHRLVAMSSFPLTALHLAMLIAFELPDYATDIKFDKKTLLVRLGWQYGMIFHNILILSAFLLLSFSRIFGYPWFATLAGLLALPIGIFQIWQLRQIGNGVKPNWNALMIGSVSMLVLAAYLITFSFWVN